MATRLLTALAVMQGGSVEVPADADVPQALRAIIAKASSRNAEDRYQNARAFLEALNQLEPALLDVDSADRERFAAEGMTAQPRAKAAPGDVDVGDHEDVIATQAISTAEVLSAKAPRGGMSINERTASTEEMRVAELERARLLAAAAEANKRVPAAETTAVEAMGSAPLPPAAPPTTTSPLLVVMNVAILILVVIILLRTL